MFLSKQINQVQISSSLTFSYTKNAFVCLHKVGKECYFVSTSRGRHQEDYHWGVSLHTYKLYNHMIYKTCFASSNKQKWLPNEEIEKQILMNAVHVLYLLQTYLTVFKKWNVNMIVSLTTYYNTGISILLNTPLLTKHLKVCIDSKIMVLNISQLPYVLRLMFFF